jgi:hypothetical protein
LESRKQLSSNKSDTEDFRTPKKPYFRRKVTLKDYLWELSLGINKEIELLLQVWSKI